MKRLSHLFSFLIIFCNLQLILHAEGDCLKDIEKLSMSFNDNYLNRKLYINYNTQTIENGKAGGKLENNLWVNQKKYKYENPYLIVFQDEAIQVSIFKDRKLIIIKNVEKDEKPGVKLPEISLGVQLDSLKRIASTINCSMINKDKKITVEFPQKIEGKKNLLKKIDLVYEQQTGRIKRGEYEYYLISGTRVDVYEYNKLSLTFDDSELKLPAMAHIMNGDKLNTTYKNFVIKDLRNKKSK